MYVGGAVTRFEQPHVNFATYSAYQFWAASLTFDLETGMAITAAFVRSSEYRYRGLTLIIEQ